ncbi:hypothetical protein JR316_0012307 [Psilocybe cubensis]|uniref:Uncharacterized protein n=1 Tax=Psilocybe cubensis TaxID=181762 RepID=A0ACB8GJ11_PSICU|nr:hypothetical protein JR316_0012307 [Psilocybe cubensis]KAH9475196.1 hypothetical protein JR316_0012307 [Psilocybe cubensis]
MTSTLPEANYGRELFRELELIQFEMRCGMITPPQNDAEMWDYLIASKSQVDRLCDVAQDIYNESVVELNKLLAKHGAGMDSKRVKGPRATSYLPSPLCEQVYPRGMVDNREVMTGSFE